MATCRQARHRSRQRTGPGTRRRHLRCLAGNPTGSLASRIGSREPDWARAADVPRKRELCWRKWRCPLSRGRVSLSSSSFPTVSHRSSRPGSPRSPSSAERVGIAADTTLQLESGRHERCTCGPYGRYEPGHDCTARGSCRTVILCVQKGPAKSERRHVGLRECPANIRSALSCHPKLKHQGRGSGVTPSRDRWVERCT